MKVFSCVVRTSKKQNKTKHFFFLKMRKKQKSKKSCKLQKTKTRKEKGKTCSMAQNSV